MNIVAHQDDDLLFMNPDLQNEINSGYCIRSIYLTAGDSGKDSHYWLGREQGSEAAYSYMLGKPQAWIQREVRLPEGQYVSIDHPAGNDKISLIYFRLPDGSPNGDGFKGDNYESLAKLNTSKIRQINSIDGQSSYSSSQLNDALVALMETYLPTKIQTQANLVSSQYPDHSDHMTAGRIATQANKLFVNAQYANQLVIPIIYYVGYPIHQFPSNVTGQDLINKENAFYSYGKFDDGACHDEQSCNAGTAYFFYLTRQYQNPY